MLAVLDYIKDDFSVVISFSMDSVIIIGNDFQLLQMQAVLVVCFLRGLGFSLLPVKNSAVPRSQVKYLGCEFNLSANILALPERSKTSCFN